MKGRLQRIGDKVDLLDDRVYAVLKDAIMSLVLEPGERLLEREIVQQLEISRTPVRRALVRLQREGFVRQVAHKGAFVATVTTTTVIELSELRQALEGFAIRKALASLETQDFQALRESCERAMKMLRDGDMDGYAKCNEEFHLRFVEAAQNSHLHSVWRNANEHLWRIRLIWGRSRSPEEVPRILKLFQEQHVEILQAAERGDATTVESLMVRHIASFASWIVTDVEAGRIPHIAVE